MGYLFAKVSKVVEIKKIGDCDRLYIFENGIKENSYEYNPETILGDDEWYRISNFSNTEYCIDFLKNELNTVEFSTLSIERNENLPDKILYLVYVDDGKYFFQKVTASKYLRNKGRWTLGKNFEIKKLDDGILLDSNPNAVYVKDEDILYFRKINSLVSIFPNIIELYREATNEETEEFLGQDFLELTNGFNVGGVNTENRKRIAIVMDFLSGCNVNRKKKLFKYINNYCPVLSYENNKFQIVNETELRFLLWGIEQRFFTKPITNEKCVANSLCAL